MSAPMYFKTLSSIEENMYNLGYGNKAYRKWFGDVTIGTKQIPYALFNFTANATAVAGDLAVVAALRWDEVAGNQLPDGMLTQSHSMGSFAQANAFAELYFEAPSYADIFNVNPAISGPAKAFAKFTEDIIHIFRGQFGTRVRVHVCPNGTALAVNGVDGAVATSVGMITLATLLPYGRIAAAGELA